MRRTKLARFAKRIAAGGALLPMVLIAGALIAASGLFSITFARSVGEPSGNALIFMLVAIAIDGYAAFAMPLLWPRLTMLGRMLIIAFLVPCLAYKVTAAHRFASENLSTRETARERQVDSYKAAERRVTDLRAELRRYASARSEAVVSADLKAQEQHERWASTKGCTDVTLPESRVFCQGYRKLQTERASARTFARLQGELALAIGRLRELPPVSAVPAEASGPVPWLVGLFGYSVGSFASFIAVLMMLIVEVGSVALPAMIGFARRPGASQEAMARRKAPAAEPPAPEDKAPKIAAEDMSEAAKAAAAELVKFLGERTDRATGERVQASALYAIYISWIQSRGQEPMSNHLFGKVLTSHLGLTKVKQGGKNWYQNVQAKAPATGGMTARHLQAIG